MQTLPRFLLLLFILLTMGACSSEIDTLLQKLKAKNSGLAEYLGESSQDQTVRAATDGFSRWRSLVYGNDSPSIPGIRQKTIFGSEYTKFEPGRTITPLTPSGQFEFASMR